MIKTKSDITSIVLIGNFNPIIFHPEWCAGHEVISQTEADDANLNYAIPQVMSYSLSWGSVEVTDQRFVIKSSSLPLFSLVYDFVMNTFDILSHTPISQMGINRERLIKLDTEGEMIKFGKKITPLDHWDFLKDPGLRDIVMDEQDRPDGYKGNIRLRIEALRNKDKEINISINDHFYIEDHKPSNGCKDIIQILGSEWENSLDRSEDYIKKIIGKFS